MENVIIKECTGYDEAAILALYKSVGWSAYYEKPEMLRRAFSASLCVLGAYRKDMLIGLIRTVGDGESIVFVQDVLVHPKYQRQGIGRKLVSRIFQRYRHVRQLHLLTDDLPQTVGFYKAVGFTAVENIHCRAFTRLRY